MSYVTNNKQEHSFEKAFSSRRSHKETVIDPFAFFLGVVLTCYKCCQLKKCVIKYRECDPFSIDVT